MDPDVPLQEWFEAYLDHHRALDHSAKTIAHYETNFRVSCRFLDETGIPARTRSLTTQQMQRFSTWLRETPTKTTAWIDATQSFWNPWHPEGSAGVSAMARRGRTP